MNQITVQKYGGTSVGTAERIAAVAERIIATKQSGKSPVVVVSAMGKTTDALVELARQLTNQNPDPREYDALLATGEMVSASLLSMHLISKGHAAISLNGRQAGISTETKHGKAKIQTVNPSRIQNELSEGKVVIITGFQGCTNLDDITTIGRGGSDTSAVVIAAALNCPECHIYTDVDGVYTTDPRIVPEAKKLTHITHDEMLELASLGAGVLHPRAVECAKEHKLTLHVCSSFNHNEGTRVVPHLKEERMETNKPVTGVAIKRDEAKLSIIDVPDKPKVAATIFGALSDASINIDMIVQSTEKDGTNNISFTVSTDEYNAAKTILESIAKDLEAAGVKGNPGIAKISIVGVGMISKPGVAAKMFETLGDAGINIDLITTSEIKISCAIPESDADKAVKVLHNAFELAGE